MLLLLAFLLAFAAPRARAQEEASFEYFYDNLKPYGEWIKVADYGLCWHPSGVDEDWAPYTDGYWAYTDAGWTWVSYEEFGDIVYHYGRWVRVEEEGWCWVPDTDWGPAWVSWRNNDSYVGWAPLPPEAHFTADVGFSTWVDDTYDIGPGYYRFCRAQDFGAPVIREVCFPRSRNVDCYRDTVNITNITINVGLGTPFCGGPRYDYIRSRSLRPIPSLKLVRETNIINIRNSFNGTDRRRSAFASVQRGNALLVPAPIIRARENRNEAVVNVTPARVLAANRVNRGWGEVKNAQEREQIRETVKQQTRGATPATAHARPFVQADVQSVPVKADPDGPSPTGIVRNRPPGKNKGGEDEAVPGMPKGATVQPGRTLPGRGPAGATAAVDEPPVSRVPQPIATPVAGKGKMGKGRPPVAATVEPLENPAGAVENPVSRPLQKPFNGNGNLVPKGRAPAVVPPVNPDQEIKRPVETNPVVGRENREPIQRAPNVVAPVEPSVQRTLPVAPQRVVPSGNSPGQPSRGGGDGVVPPRKGASINPARSSGAADDSRQLEAAREQSMIKQQQQAQQKQRDQSRQQLQAQQAQQVQAQREQARQQQQASIAAQERVAVQAEARQRAAAAADARERASAAAAAAASRQPPARNVQNPPSRPGVPSAAASTPSDQDPRRKGKDKDKDDNRR